MTKIFQPKVCWCCLFLLPLLTLLSISCSQQEKQKESQSATRSVFQVPDTSTLGNDDFSIAVKYGVKLIKNTSYYLGPDGIVSKNLGNKMNCVNCHLENGTKPFGLNFFGSHKNYPQYRARENEILSLSQRVNNCIERPHSGKPIPLDSKEMTAIVCYIKWLGENYNEEKYEGYGLKKIDYTGLRADSDRGKLVYKTHCTSCHQSNGEGLMDNLNVTYVYPPLWGKKAYQEASSMHRVLKAASFIKYNMPNGVASYLNPVLTDQEALDVAAFINDFRIHERPKATGACYPNINTKPIDFFKGPYVDNFSEEQHTFGPWSEIEKFYKVK